ncbi:DUF5060 domain-containing protein [bacterium]|nr:DUF5060 domain-containing protein [bacterium]
MQGFHARPLAAYFTVLAFGLVSGVLAGQVASARSSVRTGTQWAPFLQWSVKNATYRGNPFDVEAAATFGHKESGRRHTTGLFYDGEDTWRFRFTGARTGVWTFTTSSADPDLAGHSGTVTIRPNPNPDIAGFLSHRGNKYAIARGRREPLEGYVFNVYMGRVHFDSHLGTFGTDLAKVAERTKGYLAEAMSNGCEIIFVHVNNNGLKYGAKTYKEHRSENPDPTCFRVLETILTTAHRQRGRVHLWMWGDQSRKWTPKGLSGGINGKVDRRLQRYIAARLGPLPGWTMGYGFDLHEWTNRDELNSWAAYLHQQFGWQHLLAARGVPLTGPDNINSYDGCGRNVPLHSSSGGPKDLQEVVAHVSRSEKTPHLYEERHTFRRPGFQLDMDGTRRLLWWQTMAGGMGGFIGFYPKGSTPFRGHPYPHPEQLRTHYAFWHAHRRFPLDMERSADLSRRGVAVLTNSDNTRTIAYQEDTPALRIDLAGMNGPLPAVAVDTRRAYAEVDLGMIKPVHQTIRLPARSDWAVAIGRFPETGKR